MNLLGDLPIKNNRQTPIVESREHYNVKARGYEWVSPGKSWKVRVGDVVNQAIESDEILLDHVSKKSRSHNQYFPRHQHKVDRGGWRPHKIDLDREQHRHDRIPVNHHVAWSAPAFMLDGTKEQQCDGVTIIDDKFLNKVYKSCELSGGVSQKDNNTTPLEFALNRNMNEVKYRHSQSGIKQRKHGARDVTPIDDRLINENHVMKLQQAETKRHTRNIDPKGSTCVTILEDKPQKHERARVHKKRPNAQHVTFTTRILEDKPTYEQGVSCKGSYTKHSRTNLETLDLQDNAPRTIVGANGKSDTIVFDKSFIQPTLKEDFGYNVTSNITSNFKKDFHNFDTTKEIQENNLQTSLSILAKNNRHENQSHVPVLDRKPFEDVDGFEMRTYRSTFDRFVPEFNAIRT